MPRETEADRPPEPIPWSALEKAVGWSVTLSIQLGVVAGMGHLLGWLSLWQFNAVGALLVLNSVLTILLGVRSQQQFHQVIPA